MDTLRGLDDRTGTDREEGHGGVTDPGLSVGSAERRMHVRAYNHWVSLLGGRPYPTIADLDPGNIADFGEHSVLLDFTGGIEDPKIAFLGRALREECGLDSSIKRIAQVPGRSLLSRLTDHYLQIIANRAPIGFEAEFLSSRGRTTFYRGILMPFSSDGAAIDFIYGVINWKELVDAGTQARLEAEVDEALRGAPRAVETAPAWADGPRGGLDDTNPPIAEDAELADRLADARVCAAEAREGEGRSRGALYQALSRAHDFAIAAEADPVAYADLLADAGIGMQARAPLTPVTKLIFGVDYDKTRLTEFAAALSFARRTDVPAGRFAEVIEREGGLKALVAAERLARRPKAVPRPEPAVALKGRDPIASVAIGGIAAGDYVVLLARANGEGALDVIAAIGNDKPLIDRAMRAASR